MEEEIVVEFKGAAVDWSSDCWVGEFFNSSFNLNSLRTT
jgi:hypothetical protein